MNLLPFADFLAESLYPRRTDFEVGDHAYIPEIQGTLSSDLLKGQWRTNAAPDADPMHGHCYAGTCALYWMLGGAASGYTPYVLSALNYPELLDPGETHWYLMNRDGHVLDVTASQFGGVPIDYTRGTPNGMMTNPHGGDKRARTIIARVMANRERFTTSHVESLGAPARVSLVHTTTNEIATRINTYGFEPLPRIDYQYYSDMGKNGIYFYNRANMRSVQAYAYFLKQKLKCASVALVYVTAPANIIQHNDKQEDGLFIRTEDLPSIIIQGIKPNQQPGNLY